MSLVAGLTQRPGLAPGLTESLRLLALSSIELARTVEATLEANVMLEREEPASLSDFKPGPGGTWTPSRGDGAVPDENEAAAEDLRTHLAAQLALERLSDRALAIAEAIVDALDEAGYLRTTNADLAAALDDALHPPATEAEIEAVVHRVQGLEPTGVAARNAAECLLLQLAERTPGIPGRACAQALLRHHFHALAHADAAVLARVAGYQPDETRAALALIRDLDPHPGYRYSTARTEYLTPELIARRGASGWRAETNPAVSPRLSVNEDYANWLAAHRGEEDAAPLAAQLAEARMLIANLAQRQATLLKVGRALAVRQSAFLDAGPAALLPLTMRALAAELGLHESTVSRAVRDKSIACPRGTIPLGHFFSAALSTTAGGGRHASRAVRARIGELIAAENSASPLSDAALAAELRAHGVQVARRTVAKYREALGLASTRERRRPGN